MMNPSNIKISIIFPSYNGENVIYDNLNSIHNLNNSSEIELIIVDNNSKDSTVNVITSFKKKLNLKLIKLKKNIGFGRACNIAVERAQGKFIYIIDYILIDS